MNRAIRFLPAAALSLLVAAAVGVDIWLLLAGAAGPQVMVLVLGVQLLVLLAGIWIVAVMLELRVFRPLRRLQDHLGVFVHSDSDHRLDTAPRHQLGEVPRLVAELLEASNRVFHIRREQEKL